MSKIVCAYCETLNESGSSECIACGAPLEAVEPVVETQSDPLPFEIQPLENMKQANDLEEFQKALIPASYALGTVWRTLGEALAIGLTAFGLGALGAITDMAVWALLGAALVGIVVGRSTKNFWRTILGAPLGALFGMLVGGTMWSVGLGSKWVVFTTMIGALLGAVIGGGRRTRGSNLWDRLRPWLGALGGIFFGVIGLFVGESIQQLIRLISGSAN
jgi:hypothetical protein